MTFIFIKIFVIFVLTFSVLSDFSALADIEETNNSGSDQKASIAKVFPDITTGEAQYNTAHGYHDAGMDITTGDANTVVGYESGKLITTGSYNTAFGSESLTALIDGSNNTAIGYRAGYSNQTGSGNVFIGYLAGSAADNDVANKLFIANSADSTPLIYGDFANNTVTINEDLTVADDLTIAGDATITGSISTSSGTISTQSGNISTSSGNISTSSGNISASNSNSTLTIGSTTLNSTELGYIDSITPGTVSASKAIVVDSNKDITGFRNITASGTIQAESIKANTITDSNGVRMFYKDTSTNLIHIGQNSMILDESNSKKDIYYSSKGNLQIGKDTSSTTTIMGDLFIQEPTQAGHASTRRYSDKVSLMAASLDTRLPLYGNKHSLTVSGASTNNETALGLNFVGIYDGLHLPIDFSLGSAFSGDYNMGKLSIGFSW